MRAPLSAYQQPLPGQVFEHRCTVPGQRGTARGTCRHPVCGPARRALRSLILRLACDVFVESVDDPVEVKAAVEQPDQPAMGVAELHGLVQRRDDVIAPRRLQACKGAGTRSRRDCRKRPGRPRADADSPGEP